MAEEEDGGGEEEEKGEEEKGNGNAAASAAALRVVAALFGGGGLASSSSCSRCLPSPDCSPPKTDMMPLRIYCGKGGEGGIILVCLLSDCEERRREREGLREGKRGRTAPFFFSTSSFG